MILGSCFVLYEAIDLFQCYFFQPYHHINHITLINDEYNENNTETNIDNNIVVLKEMGGESDTEKDNTLSITQSFDKKVYSIYRE